MNNLKIKKKFFGGSKRLKKSWWGCSIDLRFHIMEQLEKLKDIYILDIGCGTGMLISEIDKTNFVVGADLATDALNCAKQVSNATFIQANAYDLPFKKKFDVILLVEIIEQFHRNLPVKERRAKTIHTIKNLSSVLKRNGKVIISILNKNRVAPGWKISEIRKVCNACFGEYTLKGWDPLPAYPYFLPSRILVHISGIMKFLEFAMRYNVLTHRCRTFLIEAKHILN